MKPLQMLAASCLVLVSTLANATSPPASQYGYAEYLSDFNADYFYADFDGPETPFSYQLLNDVRVSPAGYFHGHVGGAGDASDTLRLHWTYGGYPALPFNAALTAWSVETGPGIHLQLVDLQTGDKQSIDVLPGKGVYLPPFTSPYGFGDYQLTLTSLGSPDLSAEYSVRVQLATVPEPGPALLLAAGLGALVLRNAARRRTRN